MWRDRHRFCRVRTPRNAVARSNEFLVPSTQNKKRNEICARFVVNGTLAAATIGPPPLMSLDFPQSLALCRETLGERAKAMENIQSAMTGQTALRTPLTS